MNEIELKFRVESFVEIKNKLVDLGCNKEKEVHQKDSVYVRDLMDTSNEEGKIFIRIREENDIVELTLKKSSKDYYSSKEIEFEVSNYDYANDFLETLNLKRWVEVDKTRVQFSFKDFNICLDEVKQLGGFIEIEKLVKNNNEEARVKQEILDLASELNIDINSIVTKHYDTMISELNNK